MLFLYETAPFRRLLGPVRRLTAEILSEVLRGVGIETLRFEATVFLTDFSEDLQIIDECTAVFAIMIYLCFLLAFPSRATQKLVGALVGIPTLLVLNLVRLVAGALVLTVDARLFTFLHDYLWQLGFTAVTLGLAFCWATWVSRRSHVVYARDLSRSPPVP